MPTNLGKPSSSLAGLRQRATRAGSWQLLPNFSYASANRRSSRATYPAVCSKRATLLGKGNGPTVCAGTERDDDMLGGQLFGPGGDYHSRILDRWAANPGRREGAMMDPERCPLIFRSSFGCAQPTEDGFSGAQNEHRSRQLGSRLCAVSRDVRRDARLSSTKCHI
jgi:hypothetical protein